MCLQFAWQDPISENDRLAIQKDLGVKPRPGYEIPLQVLENARTEKAKKEMKLKELDMFSKILDSVFQKDADKKAKKQAAEQCKVDPYMDNTGAGQEERNQSALGSSKNNTTHEKAPEVPLETDTATAAEVPKVPLQTSEKKIEGMIDLEVQETDKQADTTTAAEVPKVPLETSDNNMDAMDLEEPQNTDKKTDTTTAAEVPEVPKTEDPENQEMEKDAANKKAPEHTTHVKKNGAKPAQPKKSTTQPKKKTTQPKKSAQPKKEPEQKKEPKQKKRKTTGEDSAIEKKPEKIDEDAIARKLHAVPQLLNWFTLFPAFGGLSAFLLGFDVIEYSTGHTFWCHIDICRT